MKNMKKTHPYHHGNLRVELLQVAQKILLEKGVEKVTIREIAREIGVSHAAPQRHFRNRQDLLDSLAVQGFSQLEKVLKAGSLDSEVPLLERLNNAALSFAHFAADNAALFELMNSSKCCDDKLGVMKEASESAFSPILELIISGQEQKIIQPGNPLKIGLVLYATLLGITTMVNGELIERDRLDDFVLDSMDHFLKGYRY